MASFREIGRAAYRAGAPCIPYFDADVQAAIVDSPVGLKSTQQIMRDWQSGWIAASLERSDF